jgi:hypothetical protein
MAKFRSEIALGWSKVSKIDRNGLKMVLNDQKSGEKCQKSKVMAKKWSQIARSGV